MESEEEQLLAKSTTSEEFCKSDCPSWILFSAHAVEWPFKGLSAACWTSVDKKCSARSNVLWWRMERTDGKIFPKVRWQKHSNAAETWNMTLDFEPARRRVALSDFLCKYNVKQNNAYDAKWTKWCFSGKTLVVLHAHCSAGQLVCVKQNMKHKSWPALLGNITSVSGLTLRVTNL